MRIALRLALLAVALLPLSVPATARAQSDVGPGREVPPALPAETVRVPQDRPTIQEAVDAAEPGGLVLISPGIYEESVTVTTPFVTIRGTDRNEVILDGGSALDDGISVREADGVSVENLTVRNYRGDGIAWAVVNGYRASYVTAYGDGEHGVSASESRYGRFEHSYASGHRDAGFSIERCRPCDAVVTDVLAEGNAAGFAGTDADGNLFVVDSEWRDNGTGIVVASLDAGTLAPRDEVVVAGNWVHDNHDAAASHHHLSFGIGIVVSGGRDDLITQNLVEGHTTFGIAVLPSVEEGVSLSQGNEVVDNVVRRSGEADLALGFPAAGGDCFSGNAFATSLPVAIEWRHGCRSWLRDAAGGSLGADVGALTNARSDELGAAERPVLEPPPQPSMPDAEQAPPFPAIPAEAVPGPFTIRDARALEVSATSDISREVTVLGFPLAASWWGVLLGVYAYALPLILYSAWVSIALWDLVRQEAVPNRTRIWWMVAVIAVPLFGPVAYYVWGRSPIQRSLRVMLVAGSLGIYVALAALAVVLGA
jgi:Right handed beta helix region/Phospholipase_D-nuclease N-terminal